MEQILGHIMQGSNLFSGVSLDDYVMDHTNNTMKHL